MAFTWSTIGGNFVSGQSTLTPTIDQPGSYTLTLEDTVSNCIVSSTAVITLDDLEPTVAIGTPDVLNCDVLSIILDGTSSSSDSTMSYNWSTSNGNIVGGNNGLTPEVNMPGTYTLHITNNNNGCASENNIIVTQDIVPPTADAGLTAELNCAIQSLNLDGSNSSQGPIFEYAWTTANGNIVSANDIVSPQIDMPGQYDLLVTNTDNGCTSTAMVMITQDTEVPQLNLDPAIELTCSILETPLGASITSNNNSFDVLWTSPNGNITGSTNTNNSNANAPGMYIFSVTDLTNQCTNVDTVMVTQDIQLPDADAGTPSTLTCTVTELNLDGSASSTNGNFSYLWSTTGGNISSGE